MTSTIQSHLDGFADEVRTRVDALADLSHNGGLDSAIDLLVEALGAGGIIQVFGTGHSESFAMEVAGRAGGLIPAHRISLRDVVIRGSRGVDELSGAELERDGSVVDELLTLTEVDPRDIFIIASNSGVNSSIVGMALAVKARGHKLIAVTSLQHTNAVTPKHPSGQRLSEVADVVIDNLAPFGDATLDISGGVKVGSVSSITAAYIAQALTIGVVARLADSGQVPPVYLSANIPGGDEHNDTLVNQYGTRIRSV